MSDTSASTSAAGIKDIPASAGLRTRHAPTAKPIMKDAERNMRDEVGGAYTAGEPVKTATGRPVGVRIAKHAGGDALHAVGTAADVMRKGVKTGFSKSFSDTFSDTDDVSSIGSSIASRGMSAGTKTMAASPKSAYKTVKAGAGTVRVTGKAVSSAKSLFAKAKMYKAERHAVKIAAYEAKEVAALSSRVGAAMTCVAHAAIAKIAAIVASAVSVPVMVVAVVCAAVIALVTMITSFLPMFHDGAESSSGVVVGVPAEYQADVEKAGSICPLVTGPIIAAQIVAESNWNPGARSYAGAQGIAQFMPHTWTSAGKDGDGDGKADINNPHDQIYSQGAYMCSLADSVQRDLKAGKLTGDPLELTIASYNAGLGNVQRYGTIPPFNETQTYVKKIVSSAANYTDIGEGGEAAGGEAGTLKPPMKLQSDKYHVDLAAMGIPATDTTYQAFQCTWWASVRRAKIGKPVDGHMGNGGQWDDTARSLGYPIGKTAKAGDVIVFEAGVLGADGYYGHVAVVEQVKDNGDILISEASRSWMAVATRSITAAQLKASSAGVTFIH